MSMKNVSFYKKSDVAFLCKKNYLLTHTELTRYKLDVNRQNFSSFKGKIGREIKLFLYI